MKFLTYKFAFMFFSILVYEQPKAVNPKILVTYPNNRDYTIFKREAYFTAQSPMGEVSVIMKLQGKPEIASFSGKFMDLEPF